MISGERNDERLIMQGVAVKMRLRYRGSVNNHIFIFSVMCVCCKTVRLIFCTFERKRTKIRHVLTGKVGKIISASRAKKNNPGIILTIRTKNVDTLANGKEGKSLSHY